MITIMRLVFPVCDAAIGLSCFVTDGGLSYLDLRGVDKMSFKFELGKPFKPFEQLMGVLPVASKLYPD